MLHRLKSTLHRLREKSHLLFYTRPQAYQATYRVTLRNVSSKTQKGSLVIPVPLATQSQIIETPVSFFPTAPSIQNDSRFNNRYAVWNFTLQPGQTQVYEQFFSVRVQPVRVSLSPCLSLSDYGPILSNAFIQPQDPVIQKIAHELSGDENDILTLVQRFNRFVISHLEYGNAISGLYSSKEAYEKRCVDCGGFATLFAALCGAVKIPSRLVCGFWAGYPVNAMHAWSEILLPDGTWLPADPSIEQLFTKGKTRKSGRLAFIGSDRIAFSVGCDIPLLIHDKEVRVDILQNPLLYSSTGSSTGPSTGPSTGIQFDFQFLTLSE